MSTQKEESKTATVTDDTSKERKDKELVADSVAFKAQNLNKDTYFYKKVSNTQAKKNPKEEQMKAFKKVSSYMKRELCDFLVGTVYLLIACVSDFVVPLYIGFVINALEKGDFDKVGNYCWQLFIIIVVS